MKKSLIKLVERLFDEYYSSGIFTCEFCKRNLGHIDGFDCVDCPVACTM